MSQRLACPLQDYALSQQTGSDTFELSSSANRRSGWLKPCRSHTPNGPGTLQMDADSEEPLGARKKDNQTMGAEAV